VITFLLFFAVTTLHGEVTSLPLCHSNIDRDSAGTLFYVSPDGDTLTQISEQPDFTLSQARVAPIGTEDGIRFDFGDSSLTGKIYYGLIEAPEDVRYAHPVYFKRFAEIEAGVADISICGSIVGKYDFVDWQETGRLRLGYRIVDADGSFLYDGKIVLKAPCPMIVDTSIVEGPLISLLSSDGAVVSFESNIPFKAEVIVGSRVFADTADVVHHEISITGLEPNKDHKYTIKYGPYTDSYSFRTAPEPGSRLPFTFAYASDGRANQGGGERSLYGVNAYVLKKIAALCAFKDVRFMQFTGDLINGYSNSIGETELQYANWKRTVEPFAAYRPFIAGFGNHESLNHIFADSGMWMSVDRFPYETESSEVIFARHFVNPKNGPESEDDSPYDPRRSMPDFPPYSETAFYYSYDNVVIVSLNSNYWYAPSTSAIPNTGGNPHAYIMDKQLAWLESVLDRFESDENIDHIFITIHTPFFPNGGHVSDDMWYNGNNDIRPYVNGVRADKGIIERRDELLLLLMDRSSKVRGMLTGDEHNYSLLELTPGINIYPDDYDKEKIQISRPLWQINNGAAGAPYYGKEDTPWMDHLRAFSTQNALILIHVHGMSIKVEVVNPDTLELIDEFTLM